MDQTEIKITFEKARKLYPGKKVGHEREYRNFVKRSTKPMPGQVEFNIAEVIPLLISAIEYLLRYHKWCKDTNKWCPEYCSFSVWINQGRWETEYPEFPDVQTPVVTDEQKEANRNTRDLLKKGLNF